MEKPPPQSAPRERFMFDRKAQLHKPIKRYPPTRTATKEPPTVIVLRQRYPLRGMNHYADLKAATRAVKQMNRVVAQAEHVKADQIAASKEREAVSTRPSRPADGRSSKGELYEYHRQRGTLHDYYRMFPALKNG